MLMQFLSHSMQLELSNIMQKHMGDARGTKPFRVCDYNQRQVDGSL